MRVCSRPVPDAVGLETERAGAGRTQMRTPLFSFPTIVLSAQKAWYGMAPGVEAAARWSHVPINAEVHSVPERLGLPAHVSWTQMMSRSAACHIETMRATPSLVVMSPPTLCVAMRRPGRR